MHGRGFLGSIRTTLDSTFGGGRKLFFPTCKQQINHWLLLKERKRDKHYVMHHIQNAMISNTQHIITVFIIIIIIISLFVQYNTMKNNNKTMQFQSWTGVTRLIALTVTQVCNNICNIMQVEKKKKQKS